MSGRAIVVLWASACCACSTSGEAPHGAPTGVAGTLASAGQSAVGGGGSGGGAGVPSTPDAGGEGCALTSARLRISEIDVGVAVVNNEDEAALAPLVISPMTTSGSRVAFMSDDGNVHVVTLDGSDAIAGAHVALPAHDLSDLYADDAGGVLLLTRDAQGGGTLNCGEPTNLCGTPPSPPIACHDMYMVRFDGSTQSWATKLTTSSASLPPYSTSKTGARVYMSWWYAHHGRIAFDGARYAGYYGVAISVSEGGCINIHQGDRMTVVDQAGALDPSAGFELGCSHSGYERIVWDGAADAFVTVCKTDNDNRIALAPRYTTVLPVDLAYANLGNVVLGKSGGYWLTTSLPRAGEPAGQDGFAQAHLLHFSTGAADQNLTLATDATRNLRAPHLAGYGNDAMLAGWESSTRAGDLRSSDTSRTLHLQALDRADGSPLGDSITADVRGNRYQDFRAFPDGSVAYAAPGSSATRIKILRVLPCGG